MVRVVWAVPLAVHGAVVGLDQPGDHGEIGLGEVVRWWGCQLRLSVTVVSNGCEVVRVVS